MHVRSNVLDKGAIGTFYSHEYLKYNRGTLKAIVGSINVPLIKLLPIGLDFLFIAILCI